MLCHSAAECRLLALIELPQWAWQQLMVDCSTGRKINSMRAISGGPHRADC